MAIALKIMTNISIVINFIMSMMELAENGFPESGFGQTKKQFVLQSLFKAINDTNAWKYIQPIFSKLIDSFVFIHFKKN